MTERQPGTAGTDLPKRVTLTTLLAMKRRAEPIAMVTAYDATFAHMLDEGGADVLLVGDSLGMVIQGHDDTLPVTTEDVLYHSRAVARGTRRAHIVADMPFMSYQSSTEDALKNAGRFLKEGGAHAVKLEGGAAVASTIARLVAVGIPVMGHVGLTPQSVHAMGGFRVQGKTESQAARVLEDARLVAEAGAYAIVLEGIPSDLAETITGELEIPTIGIGAGPACDGQVLVSYDLLGLLPDFSPRFVKRYAELYATGKDAVSSFVGEVKSRAFPTAEHGFGAVQREVQRDVRQTHPRLVAVPSAPAPKRSAYGPNE
jgi:3-methyl-2-oxobutanoate hydroxymethyltransferase